MHIDRYALTAIHDRYKDLFDPKISEFEVHHWNRAMALFNQKLGMQIVPADKDPIFATSALLKGV